MTAMAVDVIEKIDVRLLANLSYNFRSPYEAIFELVDNGLGSGLQDQPVRVAITGTARLGATLKVMSKGGTGMGRDDLSAFLHWGKAPGGPGLHRYGQGGKAAVGYLGSGLRVRANRFDELHAYEFEDADWLFRPDGKLKRFRLVQGDPAVPGVGVVQLQITGLKKTVNMKKLVRELSWRYAPALRQGSLELLVSGRRVEPVLMPADSRTDFEHELRVPALTDPAQTITVSLKGWVGIAPAKFDGRGGVRCSAFGRVVEETQYFGHKNSAYKASLNSLVGEVDLWFVPILLNKTGFDSGSAGWELAQALLFEEMQPFIDRLLQRKESTEPSDEDRLRAMEARDIARKALEELAEESIRVGLSGDLSGRKPPEPWKGKRAVTQSQDQVRETMEPRTPPPPNAVGRLARRGRRIDWDVRALDQKTRSMTDEVNGRTEVVINSQFPLYKERSGDLLYMLETGLLEELKPGSDEDKTLEEYTQQVASALFLAVTESVRSARTGGKVRA